MNDTQINALLQEIKNEQHPSPHETDESLRKLIKQAEYYVNKCGPDIDYETDLDARSLLKDHVLHARFQRLAEFEQKYGGAYAELQAKYYKPTNIQWW